MKTLWTRKLISPKLTKPNYQNQQRFFQIGMMSEDLKLLVGLGNPGLNT